jgi:ABC-type branched-subunit amino acid transport system substrate-binding protein
MKLATKVRTAGIVLGTAAVLAACSSGSTSGASTSAPKFRGKPLVIGIIVPTNTSSANFPEAVGAAKAAAIAMNANGGIAGRKVQVNYCNEENDPNAGAQCVRTLQAAGAVAVVSAFSSSNAPGLYSALQGASMASVGGIVASATELSSPVSFPVDSPLLDFIGCGAQFLPVAKVTKFGAVQFDISASDQTIELAALGASSVNGKIAVTQKVPETVTDFTSTVNAIQSARANGVVLSLPEQQSTQYIQTAYQLGSKPAYCTADGQLSNATLQKLGTEASRIYQESSFPPVNVKTTVPAMKTFFKQMKVASAQGVSSTDVTAIKSTSLRAWVAMQVIKQIATGIQGPITAQSFLKAINVGHAQVVGLTPLLNFAVKTDIPNPGGPTITQIFNPLINLEKWNSSAKVFVTIPGLKPLNALGVLNKALGK